MLLRFVAASALGAAVLAADVRPAAAQGYEMDEKRQMLMGGAPRSRTYGFFGGWNDAIPKTTVSYSGAERPGTIIINTTERRSTTSSVTVERCATASASAASASPGRA